MASVNKQIAELDQEERELLEFLLKEEGINLSQTLIIPERRASNIAPLSFSQESLWFLRQIEPDNPFYSKAAALRLKGPLNFKAFIETLRTIVQRHEILRTIFPSIDGRPCQVIQPVQSLNIGIVDLDDLSEPEQETELYKLIVAQSRKPFDIEREPLLRLMLLRISKSDHVLFFSLHHIISDAWSGGILIRELTSLYNAFSKDNPSPLPDLPVQYADFAIWQRKRMQDNLLESELAYWKEHLAGPLPVLKLPTDHARPAIQTVNSSEFRLEISRQLTESLSSLSRAEGVTLFMTLLASFKALIYRYTGEKDLLVGTPITNRSQSELEGLIGMFVNTLVLRTGLTRDTTFKELLGRVREVALGAYAHQELPFEKIVEELNPARSLSHTPVCQVWFVFQDAPLPALEMSGLSLTPIEIHNKATRFELILDLVLSPAGIEGCFEYHTDLFDRETMKRMVEHYRILLEGICAYPNKKLSELDLLTADERHQLLNEFNARAVAYDRNALIGEWFSQQAEQTPNAIALEFESQQLSYKELNRRANQLARFLNRNGVKPDVRVGVRVGRGLNLVIGLLGVLKAGGAYVPLDPSYPKERLDFMLADSNASVLLTERGLADVYSVPDMQVIYLDQSLDTLIEEGDENLALPVEPENLAYLIYTSGSTGKPKGAMITHRGLRNYLAWAISAYQVSEATDSLVHSSISFDLTITALFSPLLVGGRVRLLAETASIDDLADALDQGTYGLLKITPTHMIALNGLLAESEPKPRSQVLVVGGEALQGETINAWRAHTKDCRIINEYGPTETVVGASIFEVSDEYDGQGSVPIGMPIANTQLYILDAAMQPSLINMPGEIYIGGDGLARGYFNRPEVTSETFIPNPFSKKPGSRLYKTGDQGKFLRQGVMVFLGRDDQMVKIRGYRVEMGEIESALCQHPGIQEAVVIAWDQNKSDKRLVAYVAGKKDATAVSELRDYLKARLPEYMVPSAYVVMEALPLTPNGKIDRQALPEPDGARSDLLQDYVAPSTPQQQALAEIWAEVLGIERVGIHDNFFKLGGDSILSILIIARARQAGIHIKPKQMFQHQTVAELVTVATTGKVIHAEQEIVTGEAIITPIQRWFFEQQLSEPYHFNQSLMLEARVKIDAGVMRSAIKHLLIHHDSLRLRFKQDESGWKQLYSSPEGDVPLAVIDVSAIEEGQQAAVIEMSAAQIQASLSLSEGPVIRVAVYEPGPDQPVRMLITAHHLVVDGVSWRILLEDIRNIYEQVSLGHKIRPGIKTTSYKRWAERLAEHAESLEVKQDLDYWTLPRRHETKPLPVDKPGGDNIEANAETVIVSLSEKETQALLRDVSEPYRAQINELLLTALAQAFFAWTGKEHLLVDMEGHGRESLFEEIDLSRTVGWFTSIYPVLLEVKSATPEDGLKAVSECLKRVPNNGVGYGLLRYMSKDEQIISRLERMTESEVSFNYLGQTDQMFSEGKGFVVSSQWRGPDRSPKGKRKYLIEVTGLVTEGKLQVIWKYSRQLHDRSTIEKLAKAYLQALSRLIQFCQSSNAGENMPSDFSLAKLKQSELNRLLKDVEFEV